MINKGVLKRAGRKIERGFEGGMQDTPHSISLIMKGGALKELWVS